MGADDAVDARERIVEWRGQAPKMIRCDNGPEFVSQSLRDWCRFNRARHRLHQARRTVAESVRRVLQRPPTTGTARDGELQQPLRGPAAARGLAARVQPLPTHQSLNYMTSAEYAHRCTTENQRELS